MVIVGNYKGVVIDSIKVVGGNKLDKDSSGKYTLRVGTNYIFRVKTNQLGNSNLTHNLRYGINIHADDCVALKSTTPKIETNGDYKIYEYQISAIKEGSQKIRFSAESEYVDCNVEVKAGGGGSTNNSIRILNNTGDKEVSKVKVSVNGGVYAGGTYLIDENTISSLENIKCYSEDTGIITVFLEPSDKKMISTRLPFWTRTGTTRIVVEDTETGNKGYIEVEVIV